MSESNCITRLLTTIRALTNFDSSNTDEVEFGILSNGKSALGHYVVLIPGESEDEWIAPTTYMTHRQFKLQVWQRHKNLPKTTAANLAARQDELRAGIMAVPRLGDTSGTIVDSNVEQGADPQEMWGPVSTRRNAPEALQWMRGELLVKITEETRQ